MDDKKSCFFSRLLGELAEGMGFEPTVHLYSVQRFSKPPPSASRPPLRGNVQIIPRRVLGGRRGQVKPSVAVSPTSPDRMTFRPINRGKAVVFAFLQKYATKNAALQNKTCGRAQSALTIIPQGELAPLLLGRFLPKLGGASAPPFFILPPPARPPGRQAARHWPRSARTEWPRSPV